MTACLSWTENTKLGKITVFEKNGCLVKLCFGEKMENSRRCCTDLLKRTFEELNEYLAGERRQFDLPMAPEGTNFQKRCWLALCSIPYGQTITYACQAEMAGNTKALRAAGSADHANPLPILIPCHRVICANGQIGGYSGGTERKQMLIDLEKTFGGTNQ